MRLVAKVYQHVNYGGEYRYIHTDVRTFVDELGFNDKVSSIIVYPAHDYVQGDKIRFYQHINFQGSYLDLGPGYYPDIHIQPYSFGDRISSADFMPVVPAPSTFALPLEVHIYQHVNYGGQKREILTSESNLINQGFNDRVSSIRILAGDSYSQGWVANFYQHKDYAGGMLQPGNFGPGVNIPDLTKAPYSFNDTISSVKIMQSQAVK